MTKATHHTWPGSKRVIGLRISFMLSVGKLQILLELFMILCLRGNNNFPCKTKKQKKYIAHDFISLGIQKIVGITSTLQFFWFFWVFLRAAEASLFVHIPYNSVIMHTYTYKEYIQ